MRSQLAKFQPPSSMNEQEVMREYARADEEKIALVIPYSKMHILNNKEFELCMNIRNKLYGGIK